MNCAGLSASRIRVFLRSIPRFGVVGIAGAVFALVTGLSADPAQALLIRFTKIVDTNAVAPGRSETFRGFGEPSLDHGRVAFLASSGSGPTYQWGIYADVGGSLRGVVDRNTPIPGGPGTFYSFEYPSLDGEYVAFYGSSYYSPTFHEGVYKYVGGSLGVVADVNTPIPGGSGTFWSFGERASLDGENVAFLGISSGYIPGIYTDAGGSLGVVADTNTVVPGRSETFLGFRSSLSADGGNVAFLGVYHDGAKYNEGVYTDVGGSLRLVADEDTPIPGGSSTFYDFEGPSLSGGNVAFLGASYAADDYYEGVYTDVGGSLRVVADLNTPVPGGGTFRYLGYENEYTLLDDGNVAFRARYRDDVAQRSYDGIFMEVGGSLIKVIDESESLDGMAIWELWLGPDALSGNQLAFETWLDDGTGSGMNAVYVATVFESVAADIKPGSDTNPINPFSRGLIPVAILGSETFDVADVDVSTLAFGPDAAAPAHPEGGHLQDVNGDGRTDLVSHYRTQETGIAMGEIEACVTGETLGGIPMEGCDVINTQAPCGGGFAAALAVPPLLWIGGRRRRTRS